MRELIDKARARIDERSVNGAVVGPSEYQCQLAQTEALVSLASSLDVFAQLLEFRAGAEIIGLYINTVEHDA